MQRRQNFKLGVISLVLLFSMLLPFFQAEETKAATSYSNAKEFYESTGGYGESYHAEMINGTIYYATSAKLASSSSNLKYYTLGFDIELSANGHSVSFAVQRTGGSMVQIGEPVQSDGYEYILYAVNDSTLYYLTSMANATEASYVLNSSVIHVNMNAILTTKKGNTLNGGVTENGYGGLNEWGNVYHLNNSSHLSDLKEIFTGHNFVSYMNIQEDLDNHLLQIQYKINGTDAANVNCSSTATVGNGYSSNNGVLYQNDSPVISASRILNPMYLADTNTIGLTKTGYHLVEGQEWIYSNRTYSDSTAYMPKEIEPEVGYRDPRIYVYANWQPNTYTVTYDANGGNGTVFDTQMTYDTSKKLRTNTFTRNGYYLPSGKEWIDADGNTYASGEKAKNLTSENGGTITLYANWQPCIYTITTDKQGGSNGTSTFFEKFETAFSLKNTFTSTTTKITIPSKTGYNFLGYYRGFHQGGGMVVNKNGGIEVSNSYFTDDTTVYASWEAKQFTVTFDKQGGTLGTDSAIATYNELFPSADAPARNGYTFKGYYTKANGKGTQIYNENMATDTIYKYTKNVTLYAHWVDEEAPAVSITGNSAWTNKTFTVKAKAIDNGVGLDSLYIYQVADDGTLTPVNSNTGLDGAGSKSISYKNTTEGIIRFKAVATDLNGNTVESYSVVYYDKTAPTGENIEVEIDGTTITIELDITDINTGD